MTLSRTLNFSKILIMSLGAMAVLSTGLLAQDAAAGVTTSADIIKWLGLGSALALGIAAAGVGIGQGRAVCAAMEGISRNPQASKDMFVPMILGLVFMEALVIFTLIFAFVFKAAVL